MGALRFSDRRFLSIVASIGLLLGMIAPALLTTFASAQEITTRSIEMSSSAISATGVTYALTFTPITTAGGFVIDFCDNTPLIGESCTAPAGLSTASITASGSGTPSATTLTSDSGAIVTDTLTGGDAITVNLNDLTNPNYQTSSTTNDGFYARVVTYPAGSTANVDIGGLSATTYTNSSPESSAVDEGGIALSTTSSFEVNGAVLESMTFCVSGVSTAQSGDDNCSDSGDVTNPNLNLGTDDGGTYVLSNNEASPSTGTVYTQLSTNAVNGAVVNIKSSATSCGGLLNVEDSSDCIAPLASGFSTGIAGFGVETGASSATATSGDSSATGVIDPETGYSDSGYYLDFTSGGSPSTGDTSPYGTPILDSNNAPVNDMNMPLVFAAASNANTPAGEYSATETLIADGTF